MHTAPADEDPSATRTIPVSVGAVIVTAVGTVLGALLLPKAGQVAALFMYWPTLAALSAMYTAVLERHTRGAMICFGFALALFAVDVLCLRLFGQLRLFTVLYFLPMMLIALIVPFLSLRLLRADVRVWRYYAMMWFIPVLFALTLVTFMLLLDPKHAPTHVVFGFVLGVPFGPWATEVVRAVSFPNAGEGFSAVLATVFTVVLLFPPLLALGQRRWAAHSLLPFAWIMAAWSFFGMVQLLSGWE